MLKLDVGKLPDKLVDVSDNETTQLESALGVEFDREFEKEE